MNQVITTQDVIQLWTIPHKKPPSITTIWRRIQEGHIPKPRRIGNTNLYNREEVIKLRDKAWGIAQ